MQRPCHVITTRKVGFVDKRKFVAIKFPLLNVPPPQLFKRPSFFYRDRVDLIPCHRVIRLIYFPSPWLKLSSFCRKVTISGFMWASELPDLSAL